MNDAVTMTLSFVVGGADATFNTPSRELIQLCGQYSNICTNVNFQKEPTLFLLRLRVRLPSGFWATANSTIK